MPQTIPTLRWEGGVGGHLILLDQARLPGEVVELHCRTVEDVWQAIKCLAVRGAPAIGVAAAYGVLLSFKSSGSLPLEGRAGERVGSGYTPQSPLPGASHGLPHLRSVATGDRARLVPPHQGEGTGGNHVERMLAACDYLATSRPTAVNLFWALERMRNVALEASRGVYPRGPEASNDIGEALLSEARAIHAEDAAMCIAIGLHGADLLADLSVGAGILTHCNAGALATAGEGTALSVIFELARRGRRPHVWVDETRPLLQGARLTAWELTQRGIDCTLICDSMAAQVMREGRVQVVITGADRIAANGDSANKIGTYSVAVLAKAHDIPFYIAAPSSTFDASIASGDQIPIEQRASEEIACGFGARTAPEGVNFYNPAFDVTPAHLIQAIITERGALNPEEVSRFRC
jgi:methylthioribose-1-phosphate isomerase